MGGQYISTDGGISWIERPIPLPEPVLEPPLIRAVAAASAGEFWVSAIWANNGLYHTTNGGVDWTLEPTVTGATMPNGYVSDILVDPADDRRIYAAYNTQGEPSGDINMARSDDAGVTWQDITVSYHGSVKIIGQSGDTIFAANGLNIVRSTNRRAGRGRRLSVLLPPWMPGRMIPVTSLSTLTIPTPFIFQPTVLVSRSRPTAVGRGNISRLA